MWWVASSLAAVAKMHFDTSGRRERRSSRWAGKNGLGAAKAPSIIDASPFHSNTSMRKLFPAAVLLVAAAAQAQSDNSERVFQNALKYTAQIKAAVPLPFDGDRKGFSTGSGFLVDRERGWVMTNAHVVSRSPVKLELAFHGTEFGEAKRVYVDPFLDMAIVGVGDRARDAKIEEAPLDCGEPPPVGQAVGAFGHPWGLKYTGTRGIISGVTARMETELLQTDAPINPGNSGGALISFTTGSVVGINTASFSGSQNTNFAVAMKYACRVLDMLRAGKDPSPPDMPVVYFKDLDEKKVLRVAKSYLQPGLLALQTRDVIKSVPGVADKIENETQLFHALRGRLDNVVLKIERDGKETEIRGRLQPSPHVLDRTGTFVSGILFGPVGIRDGAEVNVGNISVHYVEAGSQGQFSEIQRGDFLEEVDGVVVKNHEELFDVLSKNRAEGGAAGSDTVTMKLRRIDGGKGIFTYIERKLRITRLEKVTEKSAR
jgi:S1-C subfamily serine protease